MEIPYFKEGVHYLSGRTKCLHIYWHVVPFLRYCYYLTSYYCLEEIPFETNIAVRFSHVTEFSRSIVSSDLGSRRTYCHNRSSKSNGLNSACRAGWPHAFSMDVCLRCFLCGLLNLRWSAVSLNMILVKHLWLERAKARIVRYCQWNMTN
jgi:hypothetical protein